jgi:hypothetical protein
MKAKTLLLEFLQICRSVSEGSVTRTKSEKQYVTRAREQDENHTRDKWIGLLENLAIMGAMTKNTMD